MSQGERQGPVTRDALVALIAEGKVTKPSARAVQLWTTAGSGGWLLPPCGGSAENLRPS